VTASSLALPSSHTRTILYHGRGDQPDARRTRGAHESDRRGLQPVRSRLPRRAGGLAEAGAVGRGGAFSAATSTRAVMRRRDGGSWSWRLV
jgi:hypothetical protein